VDFVPSSWRRERGTLWQPQLQRETPEHEGLSSQSGSLFYPFFVNSRLSHRRRFVGVPYVSVTFSTKIRIGTLLLTESELKAYYQKPQCHVPRRDIRLTFSFISICKNREMATPALLNSIIVNNNNGASMIEQGDCKNALSHLSAAIQSTKACIVQENDDRGNTDDECGARIISSLDALISNNALRDASGDDGYLIFDLRIRIPEPLGDKNTSRYPSTVWCSTISIFNLALAHHREGFIRPPAESYVTLTKAAKLYNFAMHFVRITNNRLIWLLLLNNLIDVYRRLGDLARAGQCCEDLLGTLVQVSDSKQVSEELFDVLYRNSFSSLLSSRCVHCASAA